MVTASGAPGTAALLRGLRGSGEREVRLAGADLNPRSVGRHLCDVFHVVPPSSDPAYIETVPVCFKPAVSSGSRGFRVLDATLEINPRISTIVYQDDLNLAYLGVRRALGEISDEELRAFARRIRPGRTAVRYFDQLEFDPAP